MGRERVTMGYWQLRPTQSGSCVTMAFCQTMLSLCLCLCPAPMAAEHLKVSDGFHFKTYLSIGEFDGSLAPEAMYKEAMSAIFKENKQCHRYVYLPGLG